MGTFKDWLGYVLDRMAEHTRTPQEFAENNAVTFVTFNFDSVIENRVADVLQKRFRGQPDIGKAIAPIPVVHVPGRLPEPPSDVRLLLEGTFGQAANEEWVQWTTQAMDNVNVVHDTKNEEELSDHGTASDLRA